jgi:uncharacterized repeat protein (TIGR01451 family)
VTFVSAIPSQGTGCTHVAGTVTCNLGALDSGASGTITIQVTPSAAQAGTTITNTVSVTSAVADPDALNNGATKTSQVNPKSDLSAGITDSPDPVTVGSAVTYLVTVTNLGPSEATGVVLTDTLPANVTFGSATPSQGVACTRVNTIVTCNLGTIGSGANAIRRPDANRRPGSDQGRHTRHRHRRQHADLLPDGDQQRHGPGHRRGPDRSSTGQPDL